MAGSQWVSVGQWDFSDTTPARVILSDDVPVDRLVSADAIRFVYLGPVSTVIPWEVY